jgi:hypothetical protein
VEGEVPLEEGDVEAGDPDVGRLTVSGLEHPTTIATSAAHANARFIIALLRSLIEGLLPRLRW